ncbi:MAG: putative metalloprotease CJM1_0395 family protein [Deltaproteobacteria bacterium]|nr:putative metalloprotease CJM1_0395 family protein [Myxococcales bacterium]MDP3219965.1 putative metalloprotease CJM1_0395 family protein [Deltaproteobacteria bacterium]
MISAVGIRVHSCRSCAACVPPVASGAATAAMAEKAQKVTRADGVTLEPGREKRPVTGPKETAGARPEVKQPGNAQSPEARRPGNAQSPEEQAQIAALRKRDADVRAHERAHQMAAGGLAGGATYTYQRGPDGQLYAIGGEVPITVGPGRTPEETLQRARTVRSAALAPAEPSGPDRAIAAAAASMEAQALQEINARESTSSKGDRRTGAYEAMSRSGEAKPEGRSLDVVA